MWAMGDTKVRRRAVTKKACSPETGEQALHRCGSGRRQVHSNLFRRPLSVSNDRATVSCNNHVYRVATVTETESHDFAAKDASSAANQCWTCFGTACWDARGDFVTAAGARIFNAPCDCNGWRWLAANWLAAIYGGTAATQKAEAACFCLRWGSERQHGHSHASCDQSTQSVHLSLSC